MRPRRTPLRSKSPTTNSPPSTSIGDLGRGEVLVAIVHRLELAAVDSDDRLGEQFELFRYSVGGGFHLPPSGAARRLHGSPSSIRKSDRRLQDSCAKPWRYRRLWSFAIRFDETNAPLRSGCAPAYRVRSRWFLLSLHPARAVFGYSAAAGTGAPVRPGRVFHAAETEVDAGAPRSSRLLRYHKAYRPGK